MEAVTCSPATAAPCPTGSTRRAVTLGRTLGEEYRTRFLGHGSGQGKNSAPCADTPAAALHPTPLHT